MSLTSRGDGMIAPAAHSRKRAEHLKLYWDCWVEGQPPVLNFVSLRGLRMEYSCNGSFYRCPRSCLVARAAKRCARKEQSLVQQPHGRIASTATSVGNDHICCTVPAALGRSYRAALNDCGSKIPSHSVASEAQMWATQSRRHHNATK